MSITTLKSLFGQKAWANGELFAALAKLGPEHEDVLRGAVRTLSHIHVVDRIFLAHLTGQPRPFDTAHLKDVPTLEQLRGEVEHTDAAYIDHVSRLDASKLPEVLDFVFTDGDKGRMSREEILLHIVTHGSSHRGNVGQMLKSISVTPPRDLYTKFLHQSEPARRSA